MLIGHVLAASIALSAAPDVYRSAACAPTDPLLIQIVLHGRMEPPTNRLARSVVLLKIRIGDGPEGHDFAYCSGVVIGRYEVLTAAHCFDLVNNPRKAGFVSLLFRGTWSTKVAAVTIAPEYRGASVAGQNHDLALIRLNAPVPRPYLPISLPRDWPTLAVGQKFRVAGFGSSGDGSPEDDSPVDPRKLSSGVLEIYRASDGVIGKAAPGALGPGDSGGPAYLADETGEPTMIGVNSSEYPSPWIGGGTFDHITELRPDLHWILPEIKSAPK